MDLQIEMGNAFIPLGVYDAVYEAKSDALVTVFRQDGVLRANVVRGNEQAERMGMEWAEMELKPLELDAKTLTSATIEGTIADESLRLLLRSSDGSKRVVFALKNGQWKQIGGDKQP